MKSETFNYEALVVGQKYGRDDLADAARVKRRADRAWTGVTQFKNCLLLWITLDKTEKEENHRYNDRFIEDGAFLLWDAKRKSKLSSKEVIRIKAGEPCFLMARVHEKEGGKAAPFVYCGRLRNPYHGPEEKPVRFRFKVAAADSPTSGSLRALFQWRPEGPVSVSEAQIDNELPVQTASKKPGKSRGQGRVAHAEFRKAVERRAVEIAVKHYQDQGLEVEDKGVPGNPFDLLCSNEAEVLRVEVKGTSGGLGAVTVTSGEVMSAREPEIRTDLAVVYEIRVIDNGEGLIGEGGTLWVDEDWVPSDESLTATQYRHQPDVG